MIDLERLKDSFKCASCSKIVKKGKYCKSCRSMYCEACSLVPVCTRCLLDPSKIVKNITRATEGKLPNLCSNRKVCEIGQIVVKDLSLVDSIAKKLSFKSVRDTGDDLMPIEEGGEDERRRWVHEVKEDMEDLSILREAQKMMFIPATTEFNYQENSIKTLLEVSTLTKKFRFWVEVRKEEKIEVKCLIKNNLESEKAQKQSEIVENEIDQNKLESREKAIESTKERMSMHNNIEKLTLVHNKPIFIELELGTIDQVSSKKTYRAGLFEVRKQKSVHTYLNVDKLSSTLMQPSSLAWLAQANPEGQIRPKRESIESLFELKAEDFTQQNVVANFLSSLFSKKTKTTKKLFYIKPKFEIFVKGSVHDVETKQSRVYDRLKSAQEQSTLIFKNLEEKMKNNKKLLEVFKEKKEKLDKAEAEARKRSKKNETGLEIRNVVVETEIVFIVSFTLFLIGTFLLNPSLLI